ncbi:uncharacterized protein LOC126678194 isoform X2 [Mercurialis annua]|uniref:uncharacterized protein LOC126678194 isoform X2 n=1 Tax=Mercurialis annua TaxID=3986 RepID=UPI002160ED08|nr:uncharacterized protein LOC126678194 isoform X2 [Mercurialis annua]
MSSMEDTSTRYIRSFLPLPSYPPKQRRSGYEPSDTETDWQESPHLHQNHTNKPFVPVHRNISPIRSGWELSSPEKVPTTPRRHTSKSPYKVRKEDGGGRNISPMSVRRNVSPFSKSEHRRQVSPFKNDDIVSSNRRKNQRDERSSGHSRRSTTAPRQRARDTDQEKYPVRRDQKVVDRKPSPLVRKMNNEQRKTHSVGEINEIVANIKMSTTPMKNPPNFETSDSISPGDIFFSRIHTALKMQENDRNNSILRPTRVDSAIASSRTLTSSASRTTINASSGLSSGRYSSESSKMSDMSKTTSASMKKFTENRRKSLATNYGWLSCVRRGACQTRRSSSPEIQHFDEATFIEKAFVVESLRQFWADKYQPSSLNAFLCHKQEAQLLKQLVQGSRDNIPHIMLKGPSGSGKRSLAMALLREIFGDACRNISHDLRFFQEERGRQIGIPISSSAHHVELNVKKEPNAKLALMSLVKEISNTYALSPEVSNVKFNPDYKVLVLYQVDKAAENIQHLIKWVMDCYTDACKLILCCEDDASIQETVTNRCKIIQVDAPVTHEIMEVLIQIARKEDFDLPMNFAARIAAKSKQNLRQAITTLEACKAHNYPFVDDQPIPSGWEEVLTELAAEILSDPSQKRLFLVRGKFQKLLVDFVHPKLILQKLVEQFLKGVDPSSKRELYYWHAYYEKRIPTGSSALLKLEGKMDKRTFKITITMKLSQNYCYFSS